MKSKIATALFSIASVMGFSNEVQVQPSLNLPIDLKVSEKALKRSFTYVRIGMADPDLNTVQTVPGIGLGYRYGLVNSAIDVSANYARQGKTTFIQDGIVANSENYSYSIPVSYLHYLSNDAAPKSFYVGGGLGWAGEQKEGIYTNGLNANATVGYEMYRTQDIHSFVQMDLSHPAINVSTTSVSLQNSFKPLAQVSFGFGY